MNAEAAASAAAALLQRGRDAEASGAPADALRHYDAARALLSAAPDGPGPRRLLALAWMNRGNVLQRQAGAAPLLEAVAAYDAAIALLGALPFAADPALRNHLGAAWLNRGHALQRFADPARLAAALHSFRTAIGLLRPISSAAGESAARANLAGALINLADTLVASDEPGRLGSARAAAREALDLAAPAENAEPLWAELGLMARRAHAMALGGLLAGACAPDLVGEASDTIESGLALVRRWDTGENRPLQPFARRFFRFGAELYRRHQPHFLAEFVLETLAAPDSPAVWAADREMQVAAQDAIAAALQDLREPQLLIAGDPVTERILATRRTLTIARERLRSLFSPEASGITA